MKLDSRATLDLSRSRRRETIQAGLKPIDPSETRRQGPDDRKADDRNEHYASRAFIIRFPRSCRLIDAARFTGGRIRRSNKPTPGRHDVFSLTSLRKDQCRKNAARHSSPQSNPRLASFFRIQKTGSDSIRNASENPLRAVRNRSKCEPAPNPRMRAFTCHNPGDGLSTDNSGHGSPSTVSCTLDKSSGPSECVNRHSSDSFRYSRKVAE